MITHLTLKENQEFELDIDLPEVFRITVEGTVIIVNDKVTWIDVSEVRGYDSKYEHFICTGWIAEKIESHLPDQSLNHLTTKYYELHGKI